jgi:lipopolysaccharide/colanic/teichoic acid biosynthesis glycosyltransferase
MLESEGSPLFIQKRIGHNGKEFYIYKFRTMENNHHSDDERLFMKAFVKGEEIIPVTGKSYKPPAQPYTAIGSFLRKTSLDELPQVFNVIRGEMSFVGPRPNVPWEVDEYQDWHCKRLSVLPGITGLAQINGRSNISFDEIVRHDIFYIRNANLKTDLLILWNTLGVVFKGRGAG